MTDDLKVTREPLTYERESPHSFFMDLARAEVRNDEDARARLARHAVETRAIPNTTAGTGGEFVPPGWLLQDTATSAKVGRHFADLIGSSPLPRGVASVNIPRIVGTNVLGQDTVVQITQNSSVSEVDDATASNASPVVTIAGKLDIAQQLIDQSPIVGPGSDAIYYTELRKDYNAVLEGQMINGTGANGQLLGLANFTYPSGNDVDGSGVGATSPTSLSALWPLLGQAAANMGNNRGHRPEFWLMAPRRWFAIAGASDSQNRPIASPGNIGVPENTGPSPHSVSNIQGIPVYTSGAVLNLGAAGVDVIYAGRHSDIYLFESAPMMQTSVNSLGGTLTARLTFHAYVAFVGNIYTSAVARVKAIPRPTNY